jgi:hypothetical protein
MDTVQVLAAFYCPVGPRSNEFRDKSESLNDSAEAILKT